MSFCEIYENAFFTAEARKLEKTNLEAERIHQENEKAKVAKAAELEMERQQALREQERVEIEQKNEEKNFVVSEANQTDKYVETPHIYHLYIFLIVCDLETTIISWDRILDIYLNLLPIIFVFQVDGFETEGEPLFRS